MSKKKKPLTFSSCTLTCARINGRDSIRILLRLCYYFLYMYEVCYKVHFCDCAAPVMYNSWGLDIVLMHLLTYTMFCSESIE